MSHNTATFDKLRIEKVLARCLKAIKAGKMPNIKEAMLAEGYSESMARGTKVTSSRTWREAIAALDETKILIMFEKIALGKKDLRAKIEAGKELLKLKDRYPAGRIKLTAYDERDEVVE